MKRAATSTLKVWFHRRNPKPLLITGAPGVGKTHLINDFGAKTFPNAYISVDAKDERVMRALQSTSTPQVQVADLAKIAGVVPAQAKVLLFIDNFGAISKPLPCLLALLEDYPELTLVAAETVIAPILERDPHWSENFDLLTVRPLNFEEYLNAIGRADAAQVLVSPPRTLSQLMHQYLMQEVKNYFLVGGLPCSVEAYAKTKSFLESFKILQTYAKNIRQMVAAASASEEVAEALIRALARSPFERVNYKTILSEQSIAAVKESFDTLCGLNLIYKISSAEPVGVSFRSRVSSRIYKSCFLDVGLLSALAGLQGKFDKLEENPLDIYRGALAEQFVAQEMISGHSESLLYWASGVVGSTATVDFLTGIEGVPHAILVADSESTEQESGLRICTQTYPGCANSITFDNMPYNGWQEDSRQRFPLYYSYAATAGAWVDFNRL